MKAAVMIDDWKLPIFTEILDEGGFEYDQHPGLTSETITLIVQTKTVAKLQPFVERANAKVQSIRNAIAKDKRKNVISLKSIRDD